MPRSCAAAPSACAPCASYAPRLRALHLYVQCLALMHPCAHMLARCCAPQPTHALASNVVARPYAIHTCSCVGCCRAPTRLSHRAHSLPCPSPRVRLALLSCSPLAHSSCRPDLAQGHQPSCDTRPIQPKVVTLGDNKLRVMPETQFH